MNASIERFGESALVLAASGRASLEAERRIWRVAREARRWDGIADAVCGANNLTLIADPDASDFTLLARRLLEAWDAADGSFEPGRLVEIPVEYGGVAGPDLSWIAAESQLDEDEVVRLHAGAEYVVWFLGFLPGFTVSRRPRSAVGPTAPERAPHGSSGGVGCDRRRSYGDLSVPLARRLALLGRTSAAMFDALRSPAALLAPGDRVRFVPVR